MPPDIKTSYNQNAPTFHPPKGRLVVAVVVEGVVEKE